MSGGRQRREGGAGRKRSGQPIATGATLVVRSAIRADVAGYDDTGGLQGRRDGAVAARSPGPMVERPCRQDDEDGNASAEKGQTADHGSGYPARLGRK